MKITINIRKIRDIGSNIPGSVLAIISALLWSLSGLAIKSSNASIAWVMILRYGSASVALLPFLFISSTIQPKKWLIYTSVFYTGFIIAFALGTRYVGAATTVATQYTAPLYLFSYDCIKNKRFPKKKAVHMGIILIGLILLIISSIDKGSIFGFIMIISTGVMFTLYSICLGKIKNGSTLAISSINNLVLAILFVFLLPLCYNPKPLNNQEVLGLIVGGILTSTVSYAIYAAALRKISAEKALTYTLCEPIFNPLWVFLFMGETPKLMAIIGIVFVIIGVILDLYNGNVNKALENMGDGGKFTGERDVLNNV